MPMNPLGFTGAKPDVTAAWEESVARAMIVSKKVPVRRHIKLRRNLASTPLAGNV